MLDFLQRLPTPKKGSAPEPVVVMIFAPILQPK
jgi:hypothetical protein